MFLSPTEAVLWLLPELKGIFHPQLGMGMGGGRSGSQQTLSLLTEHVNKQTHTHTELIRKTITPPSIMFQCTAVRMTSNFPLFHFMSHGIQMRRLMMPFNGIYKRYLSKTSPQPVIFDNNALLRQPVINSIPIPNHCNT